jgi:hypothetical protein
MSLCRACNAISCSVHSLYYPHVSSNAALPLTHSFSCSFAEKEHAFQPTKQALASAPLPGPLINKAQSNPFAPTAPLTSRRHGGVPRLSRNISLQNSLRQSSPTRAFAAKQHSTTSSTSSQHLEAPSARAATIGIFAKAFPDSFPATVPSVAGLH